MTIKPVLRRKSMRLDLDQASAYYEEQADSDVALRFVDAVEAAIRAIEDMPSAGSGRWGQLLKTEGLRTRPVDGFPYLIFYLVYEHKVEIWRLLHAKRDIPFLLADPS